MGRIRGWEKVHDNKDFINWKSKNSEMFIDDSGIENKQWRSFVLNNSGRQEEYKEFDTKAEAQAFAIKWMRSHPNG